MALQADADEWTLRTARNEEEMWALAEREGVSEARQAYPSGWLFLTRDAATRELARLAAATGGEWGADELARELDAGPDHIPRALDDLVALRVFHESDGTYQPNETSVVARTVGRLDNAIESADASAGGFRRVAEREEVRLLLDALLYVDPERRPTQSDLHELVGLSRKAVWMHVDSLVDLGVLEERGDDYAVDESSPVLGHVRALDAAVLGAAQSP